MRNRLLLLPAFVLLVGSCSSERSTDDSTVTTSADPGVTTTIAAATTEGDGYSGPTDIGPTTVDHIVELRQTENWEGMTIWAIGVDEEYPFTVITEHAPERLVIDFQVVE